MANLNKELRKLFFATLKRKAEEASKPRTPMYLGGTVPPVTHRPTTYQPNLFSGQTDSIGCIYFYEWSDTTRNPKTYYTLKAFENFLNDCHIYLASWQREVLSHMKHRGILSSRTATWSYPRLLRRVARQLLPSLLLQVSLSIL